MKGIFRVTGNLLRVKRGKQLMTECYHLELAQHVHQAREQEQNLCNAMHEKLIKFMSEQSSDDQNEDGDEGVCVHTLASLLKVSRCCQQRVS